MGLTIAEKILARASGNARTAPGDYVTARADRMMVNDMFVLISKTLNECGVDSIADPEKAYVIFDHFSPPPSPKHAQMLKKALADAISFDIPNIFPNSGVSHQVMCESGFVRPGELILGTDSHSTMYGAFAAAGAGIGATEMAYLLATGELWMQVPSSIQINLIGKLAGGVYAKDIILHIIGSLGGDYARYKSIEYTGDGAASLSMSQRMTISNMGAEIGAKFAFFNADELTRQYLYECGVSDSAEFSGDNNASYEAVHEFDLSRLSPQVACPHQPENVKNVKELETIAIDQAYLGSCTNARLDDLKIAANILRDQKVSPSTRLLVAPASQKILLDATRAGYITDIVAAGATILPPGCGACAGLHSGLLGKGDVCLSSTNRNFTGRMGSPEADIYLASPATVAASAIAGKIVDPRTVSTQTI